MLLLAAFLSLTATGVASAHVGVSPEEVPAGEYEKLVVTVPTEKEIPTTEVRVEVPEGFVVSGVQPVPGWEHAALGAPRSSVRRVCRRICVVARPIDDQCGDLIEPV